MQNEKVAAGMQDNVTQAIDWSDPLEAYHPDGRCLPVQLDRRDHHVCYLSYHPFGETVYYDDGTAYDDDSEWRIRNRLASTTAQSEAVQKLVEAWSKRTGSTEVTGEAVPYLKVYFDSKDEVRAFNDAICALAAHRESQP